MKRIIDIYHLPMRPRLPVLPRPASPFRPGKGKAAYHRPREARRIQRLLREECR